MIHSQHCTLLMSHVLLMGCLSLTDTAQLPCVAELLLGFTKMIETYRYWCHYIRDGIRLLAFSNQREIFISIRLSIVRGRRMKIYLHILIHERVISPAYHTEAVTDMPPFKGGMWHDVSYVFFILRYVPDNITRRKASTICR